jgi:two-component system OmpR family sensor kinase
MKRYLLFLAAVGVPLAFGFGLSLLFETGILPNRLLVGQYVISFSGLASRLGMVAAVLAAAGVALLWWAERRIARAELLLQEQQAEARRRFLQRLDHELKNPLTIIRLGIVNLQHGSQQLDEQAASLARIGQQVQRLGRLIIDLRWLGELEARSVEHRPVNLQQVLAEVVEATEEIPEYGRRRVDVNIQQIPWPVASVWGDRDLLMVVFRNLIDNALKYTSAGDRVEVRAFDDGDAAIVEIADTGPGIPDEEVPHIFEELYRGENARAVSGSGLGLALVRRIVALHNGTVAVRSRVGHGTVMSVRLPLAPQSA